MAQRFAQGVDTWKIEFGNNIRNYQVDVFILFIPSNGDIIDKSSNITRRTIVYPRSLW